MVFKKKAKKKSTKALRAALRASRERRAARAKYLATSEKAEYLDEVKIPDEAIRCVSCPMFVLDNIHGFACRQNPPDGNGRYGKVKKETRACGQHPWYKQHPPKMLPIPDYPEHLFK